MSWRGLLLTGSLFVAGGFLAHEAIVVYNAPGPLTRPTAVVVPRGSVSVVADALLRAGVLEARVPFRAFAGLTAWQGPLRSAEFLFPKNASLAAVLAVLRAGRPVQHLLTIPEGVTASRIAMLVADASALVGDVETPAEGEVLPESYAYVLGVQRSVVMARAARSMAARLGDAWRSRAADVTLRSPREMLILASMVERETHVGSERPMVARVLLNRLGRGMRLQSDPTVAYGDSGGANDLSSGLSKAALERDTPYNTYVLSGLPAGPICAPGLASIDAVAHPARSKALYFVADGRGGLVFADTLEEHNRNVERYRGVAR